MRYRTCCRERSPRATRQAAGADRPSQRERAARAALPADQPDRPEFASELSVSLNTVSAQRGEASLLAAAGPVWNQRRPRPVYLVRQPNINLHNSDPSRRTQLERQRPHAADQTASRLSAAWVRRHGTVDVIRRPPRSALGEAAVTWFSMWGRAALPAGRHDVRRSPASCPSRGTPSRPACTSRTPSCAYSRMGDSGR